MTRYAVYYAPKPGSPLWRAGCQWLGGDVASGQALTQPQIDGIDAGVLATLTRDAARYGWHATLKAPFPLRIDVQAGALLRHVAELAAAFRPFALSLQVDWLDSFLALRPVGVVPELDELAAACAVALEPLADRGAPLKPRAGLDPRQQALYRWNPWRTAARRSSRARVWTRGSKRCIGAGAIPMCSNSSAST
ncbi:DUF1045 domain-containing protein (plasmid) [Chromobacterium amazonense]|uniref:DUF1045 domain-containing protein n=1 Tax=Chromobacterium amazonense TaxID=1382803 RepID=UPI00237E1BBD|nr:DUF1045 domain-containing protein [Chromobacterium amazonense]MDE1712326.1 DUF1045 domain-containing protein [Chromobacterium amazonense]